MNIEVSTLSPQIAVATKATGVTMENMTAAIDTGYEKLMQAVSEQGAQLIGAPYCAYLNSNEDFTVFDIELGIPVNTAISANDEVYMSQTYDGKAVISTHQGSYATLESTYEALMVYLQENQLESTGVYYDYYLSNPLDTPEDQLLTQVVFPIN
ncbi:GyrI-like domain-containing protein [Candidatus Enterococcus mangumiae]|uniref:AraC effector-binding domain-containing protein n=1 Tax=Candidatus Enterococcus mangumiae TaxID=2230878 RepID=A0ABZ2SU98_9ENTE|nr:GyrI-like domain-containing protein [Enterococcus sp. DIV1094]MBO0488910.1 GyrI-like domain-containing protein [Enterococcus sp. DIV1094]